MDYTKIVPFLMKYLDFKKVSDLLRFYEAHKELIDTIFKLFNRPPAPTPGPVVVPPGPPIVPPAPVVVPPVVIANSIKGKVFYFEDDRHGGSGGEILPKETYDRILSDSGPDAQMQGQRAHLDFTPLDKFGVEVPREVVRERFSKDGEPVVTLLWGPDPDNLSLESFADQDVGFTPVLNLEEISSGRHKVWAQLVLPASVNGGLELRSNLVWWYVD